MGKVRYLFVISLSILFLISSSSITNTHADTSHVNLMLNESDEYEILIVAYQWDYHIFDLVALNQDPETVLTPNSSDAELGVYSLVMDTSKEISIHLTSLDVQHGFAVDELNISIALNRPVPGQSFGDIITVQAPLPNNKVEMRGYAYIFNGLGYVDMKKDGSKNILFYVGDWEFNDAKFPIPFAFGYANFAMVTLIIIRKIIIFKSKVN